MSIDMKAILAKVADGKSLSEAEAHDAFNLIMSGEATQAQIGGFLMALRVRGETVAEISGAVKTMRAKMTRVSAPSDAIDIVGTGGDGSGTLNISTGTAIVVAGCGVTVAKHGNKALSSKSGAADVLTSLGVNMAADIPTVEKAINSAGIGFMMAPLYHSAMKYVGGPRVELGIRTVFNLVGPLSNPAGVKRQLTGVFSKAWLEPVAEVLSGLGSEKGWVVHGSDGTDELTMTGPSFVTSYDASGIKSFEVSPEDAGLPCCKVEDLKGGDGTYNAAAIHALLDGAKNAYRDVVLFNASAALQIAGKASDWAEGVEIAREAIDSGKAKAALASLVQISNA